MMGSSSLVLVVSLVVPLHSYWLLLPTLWYGSTTQVGQGGLSEMNKWKKLAAIRR